MWTLVATCALVGLHALVGLQGSLALGWPLRGAEPQQRDLVGWAGETFNPLKVFGNPGHDTRKQEPARDGVSGAVSISHKPQAQVWHSFISKAEARHIVQLAAPLMKRSGVGNGDDGYESEIRTSYGMFIRRYQDALIAAVEERVSEWTNMPVSHQEDMQVLRYAPGQVYKPHSDANGRICTVLIYLNDVAEGGETAFVTTQSEHWLNASYAIPDDKATECSRGHVAVRPEQGLALLFWSMPPAALTDERLRVHTDPYAEHTGCPPLRESKWTLTIWIHPEPFRPADFSKAFDRPMPNPALCEDSHDLCHQWAGGGECTKNPGFMLGSKSSIGMCRLACKACVPCPLGDTVCSERMRLDQGYMQDVDAEITSIFGPADTVDQTL